MDLLSLALEAIPKALIYAAVILSVGTSSARVLFLTRVGDSVDDDHRSRFESALARVALWSACGAVASLLLRAWGHTAVSFSLADALLFESVSLVAWQSQWGEAWKIQMGVALALVVVSWGTSRLPQFAWPLTGLAALALCYALPLVGHAEGEPSRLLLHGSHILGAGVWVGTLMAMTLARVSSLRPVLLTAFAPFAFLGSSVLALTGLVAAWTYLGSPMNLIDTTYGWILVLKLVFVADVAAFGFLNWRRLHGPVSAGINRSAPHALVIVELAMAVAVIVVTAVLTELEHP